jgi:hypothetical protein
MEVADILQELTPYTGTFPQEAVEAAIQSREVITPHLLGFLEQVAEAPERFNDPKQMLHVFATYLLAQFREKRAFRLLCRILMAPGNLPKDLFGETITDGLSRILASVYDGDPAPLMALVENENVDDFVRWAAVDTFVVLSVTGQMPREEVIDYFRQLFHGKLARTAAHVWIALAGAVGDMSAPELIPELRKAYGEGLIDPGFAELEDLERDAHLRFQKKSPWQKEQLQLVDDAITEMEWWASFHREDEPDDEGWEEDAEEELGDIWDQPTIPYVRCNPKIGRNDPCPCGSGKKYKKCCLANDSSEPH